MEAEQHEQLASQSANPESSESVKPHHLRNGIVLLLVFVLGILVGYVLNTQGTHFRLSTMFSNSAPSPLPKRTLSPTPTPTAAVTPSPTPMKTGILTFPTLNATLCRGKEYSITWQVPSDTQIVSLHVLTPEGQEYKIVSNTNPGEENASGNMSGSFIWNPAQNLDGAWLTDGPGYRLAIIVSGSSNASYENYGNYFTLTNCPQ